MKLQLYIIFLLFNFGCKGLSDNSNSARSIRAEEEMNEITTEAQQINSELINNLAELKLDKESKIYESVKSSIETNRKSLNLKNVEIDSISKIFEISLVNRIIPFWEETRWSFEGHTSKPKSGTIACGYFVSTTLQDIGMNLNRYKLAQQSPINEAKSLAINAEVKEFSKGSSARNISAIAKYLEEGIHYIGFDQSHVGYILKKKDKLYLIHSNYIVSIGVQIEQIEKSEVFQSYSKFYIVKLSTNENLLRSWIQGKQIEIIDK
jgi:hypothetical protein